MTATSFRLYTDAGKDGYPPEWHKTLKHLVRELAGHRCVRCFHPYKNGEHGRGEWSPCDEQCRHRGPYRYRACDGDDWHESLGDDFDAIVGEVICCGHEIQARWRILTVHHLDGKKLNCRWWNLAALCQVCHLSVQNRAKFDRPYLLEHSEWMKPYVAGFYALKYEGLDLSREQVMLRLDELLNHERVM